jgi:hypothetical protein
VRTFADPHRRNCLHIRSFSAHLPDFVYENGERQTSKPVKRAKPGAPLQVRLLAPEDSVIATTSRPLAPYTMLTVDLHRSQATTHATNGINPQTSADLAPEGQPFKKPRASSFIPESANTASATSAAITLPSPSAQASAPSTPSIDAAKRLQRLTTDPALAGLPGSNGTPQPDVTPLS